MVTQLQRRAIFINVWLDLGFSDRNLRTVGSTLSLYPHPLCCFINKSSLICLTQYRADEEPVDQKKDLEESCKPKCVKPLLEYQV